jgi:hypothetical protein
MRRKLSAGRGDSFYGGATALTGREPERARRDFRFACRCCRAALGVDDDEARLSGATPSAVRRVLRERVAGLAYLGLRRRGMLGILPGKAGTSFRAAYAANTALNGIRREAILKIAAEFTRRGIPYRLLRGAAIVSRLYGDPGVRPCVDQDLLVRPADREATEAALGTLDFQHDARYPGVFIRDRVLIDLHSSLGNLGRVGARRHVYAALEERVWGPPGNDGDGLHVLPPAVDFLHLACHALKHAYGHLIWVADLAAWVRTFGPDGLAEAARLASSTGLTWPVLWALRMVRDCLGGNAAVPIGRRDALCGGGAASRILTRIARGETVHGAGAILTAMAAGSFPRAAAVLWGSAFPRAAVMRQIYPGRSAPAAYLLRSADSVRALFSATSHR